MSAEMPIFHGTNLFNWYREFLIYFTGSKWLENPNSIGHIAVVKKKLCEEVMSNNGILLDQQQGMRRSMLAEIALDASILHRTLGEDFENVEKGLITILCDESARHHIETRLRNPEQFESLMVELYVSAWYGAAGIRLRRRRSQLCSPSRSF